MRSNNRPAAAGLFIAVLLSTSFGSASEPPQIIEGVRCVVDDQLAAMNDYADDLSQSSAESFMTKGPPPTEKACLPTLQDIAGGITGSLPSMNGGGLAGILSRLGDAACKAMDNAIRDSAGRLQIGWEAPYGLGEVTVGTNRNGQSGIDISEKEPDIVRAAEDLVMDRAKQQVNGVVGTAKTSDVIGVNREAADKSRDEWREIRDSVLKK